MSAVHFVKILLKGCIIKVDNIYVNIRINRYKLLLYLNIDKIINIIVGILIYLLLAKPAVLPE